MIVKTCQIHGPLTEARCYGHSHGPRGGRSARVDFECKECVKARQKTPDATEKRRTRIKERYREDPGFREQKKASEIDRYRRDPQKFISWEREGRRRLKREVLAHYSGSPKARCVLCSEGDLRFLALDHTDGKGAAHRRENPSIRGNPYRWAKKHGLPSIFRTLCHNCNVKETRRMSGPGESDSSRDLRHLKQKVFSHYCNPIKCAMCGQDDLDVLTLDHMNGRGNEHRRSLRAKTTWALYRWIRKNGFPDDFRVLCFNHNLGAHCLGD